MKKFFDLNNVQKHTKGTYSNFIFGTKSVCMVSMAFLSYKKIITWDIFTNEIIAHYEDTKRNTFF